MSKSLARETGAHTPTASVLKCAQKCFESFQNCLNSASKSDKPNAPWPKLPLVRVEDQLARFQLWAANIRLQIANQLKRLLRDSSRLSMQSQAKSPYSIKSQTRYGVLVKIRRIFELPKGTKSGMKKTMMWARLSNLSS
ncbi:hypothetical protein LB505_012753 [Fusarium chuoi]|nr:hypothetical protein LB505_012753 [Fusarium chuoi]